jgi:hypothetical protein
MALSAANLAKIHASTRQTVKLTLDTMKPYVIKDLWLSKKNRYATETITRISSDAAASTIKSRQLAQYIAASVILHCSDGWSYLGRALAALLRGDPHRARHLSYYAELRAAMSILASNGIGVFNTRHFVIDGVGSVTPIAGNLKTHAFVWESLVAWGDMASSGQLFAEIVRPHGISLSDWLSPVGGPAAVAAQAKGWFAQWGMDLDVSKDDQMVRSESSYRPDGIKKPWAVNGAQVVEFARDFWASMEPSTLCRFENVDSHILRVALESAFRGRTGKSPAQAHAQFGRDVKKVVAQQALDPHVSARWTEFIRRKRLADDASVMKWSAIPPSIAKSTHFSVFSRAALLLRLATGSALELERDIGLSAADTSFWWDTIGNCRGMWDGQRDPTTILDLWADIEPVLASIDAYQTSFQKSHQTLFHASGEMPDLNTLGSCERIAIWGLTPS